METTRTDTQPQPVDYPSTHESKHDPAHGPTANVYYTIFGSLAVLTFITVFVSRVHLPMVAAVVMALLIAVSKATLVIAFFMHVKYDPRVIRLMCVLPVILTMIAMMALLPDIAMHGPTAAGAPEAAAKVLTDYESESAGKGHPDAAGTENAAAAVENGAEATATPAEETKTEAAPAAEGAATQAEQGGGSENKESK